MFKVYVAGSMQEENVGVGEYGTEENRMFQLSDKVRDLLIANGNFEVFGNKPEWSITQMVYSVNSKCDKRSLFIDNHSNAGEPGAQGTEVYYYGQGGELSDSYRIANLLYKHIAPLSVGEDRGIKPDNSLYTSGLYVIQNTVCPACVIEHIFHTNAQDVADFLDNMDKFARAEYEAICMYFGVPVMSIETELREAQADRDFLKCKFDRIRSIINE